MADFLTRLIERSRGFASQGQAGQRIEPLIAPLYAAQPSTVLPNATMDEELILIAEPESRHRTPALHITESTLAHWPKKKIEPSPQRREPVEKVAPEIRPAQTPADKTQSAQFNQTSSLEPLPRTTPKSTLPPAPLVDARLGLIVPADQSQRANREPLVIRPQVARADESNSRANEAANESTGETSAPIIRVTIGRIDVRAVNAPAPPARRAMPSAPKLSLEEYLRSRNGGKR